MKPMTKIDSTMKKPLKSSGIVFGLLLLSSCYENRIDVSDDGLLPEPDKEMRIASEINTALTLIAEEITDSDQILVCEGGRQLINSGKEILPHLKQHFADSTETKVYSKKNKRTLYLGEIAIITAHKIKPIPIARVVGVQQCIPPISTDIESFLWSIQKKPEAFQTRYNEWLKETW